MDERAARDLGAHVPMIAEVAEIAYQWSSPFVSDASAFEAAFGPFPLTPHATATR